MLRNLGGANATVERVSTRPFRIQKEAGHLTAADLGSCSAEMTSCNHYPTHYVLMMQHSQVSCHHCPTHPVGIPLKMELDETTNVDLSLSLGTLSGLEGGQTLRSATGARFKMSCAWWRELVNLRSMGGRQGVENTMKKGPGIAQVARSSSGPAGFIRTQQLHSSRHQAQVLRGSSECA